MYRKIEKEEKSSLIDNSLINDELKKIILVENEKRIISSWKPKEKSTIFTFNINGDVKFLNACKSETIYELKKAVLREYKMEGWEDDKNFRLRVISQNLFFQDSFPNEEMTLEEAGIYNNRIYSFETKKGDNQFEEYIEKNINIMINFWDKNEEEPEFRILKINKDKLMIDLKNSIYTNFHIKNNSPLYCFKKVDLNSIHYNLIDIFEDNNINKPIYSYVFEGMKIYVEVTDIKMEPSKFKKVSQKLFRNSKKNICMFK